MNCRYFKVSAKTGDNIVSAFSHLLEEVYQEKMKEK